MAKHRILVPVDFTPVAINAVNHAVAVGKAFESEFHLLHIVAKKSEFSEARTNNRSSQTRLKSLFWC